MPTALVFAASAAIVVAVLSVTAGIDRGRHEGKWRERCRHTQCDYGQADWAEVNGKDACVCVTTARGAK